VAQNKGNGFLFKNFDSSGLLWAIEQAMVFYNLPKTTKAKQIYRIMQESAAAFTHANTARQYIALYEKMLKRPLILQNVPKPAPKKKAIGPKVK
jgi:starch synthase/alpha-amylase